MNSGKGIMCLMEIKSRSRGFRGVHSLFSFSKQRKLLFASYFSLKLFVQINCTVCLPTILPTLVLSILTL